MDPTPQDRDLGSTLGPRHRAAAARLAEEAVAAPALAVRRLTGGHANTTLAVRTADGGEVVVRLYERRPGIAPIEQAVLTRAAGVVPVPAVLLADPDGSLTGQPALVQRYVKASSASEIGADTDPDTAAEVGELLGATLVGLQQIRFPRAGFFTGPDLVPGGMDGSLPEQLAAHLEPGVRSARQHGVDAELLDGWRRLVLAVADDVAWAADGDAVLVHADYNPKNVLLDRVAGRWRVAAVLDWEFAFAGSWLYDLGNLTRFAHHHPPAYVEGIARGVRQAGATLPDGWREAAAVLDSFALAEFLERGPDGAFFDATVELIRSAVARGAIVPGDV